MIGMISVFRCTRLEEICSQGTFDGVADEIGIAKTCLDQGPSVSLAAVVKMNTPPATACLFCKLCEAVY